MVIKILAILLILLIGLGIPYANYMIYEKKKVEEAYKEYSNLSKVELKFYIKTYEDHMGLYAYHLDETNRIKYLACKKIWKDRYNEKYIELV